MGRFKEREVVFDSEMGQLRPLGPVPQLTSAPLNWCGFRLEQHWLPSFESRNIVWMRDVVILLQSEAITIEINEGEQYVRKRFLPGSVSLRPAQARTSARCMESTRFLTVSLDPTFLNQACGEWTGSKGLELTMQHGIQDRFIEGVCLALHEEVLHNGRSGRFYSESLARSLAVHLACRYGRRAEDRAQESTVLPPFKIRQALDYIHGHFREDLSVADIARSVALSRFHFTRIFKLSTGLSPHQYILRYRVERARQLLLRGDLPIASIALETGFCDQSHFTAHFRRVHGTTPHAYGEEQLRKITSEAAP
jgi:AraC family transcriptional regulator